MSLPKRHRVALVKEFGRPLIIEDVPTPEPRGRQVLIKVISAGIRHTDMTMYGKVIGRPQAYRPSYPS